MQGHKCKNQRVFRLALLSEHEEEERDWGFEEEETKDPQPPIELLANSLVGIVGVSLIRFVGKIAGKELSFLTDIGVTHNFIDPVTVKRLGILTQRMNPFEVEVADGEKVIGRDYCKNVVLSIQGFESHTDLLVVPLVVPLGDAQVMLGTVWLKSLEPTLWDFSKKTLRFWKEERKSYHSTWCTA